MTTRLTCSNRLIVCRPRLLPVWSGAVEAIRETLDEMANATSAKL